MYVNSTYYLFIISKYALKIFFILLKIFFFLFSSKVGFYFGGGVCVFQTE